MDADRSQPGLPAMALCLILTVIGGARLIVGAPVPALIRVVPDASDDPTVLVIEAVGSDCDSTGRDRDPDVRVEQHRDNVVIDVSYPAHRGDCKWIGVIDVVRIELDGPVGERPVVDRSTGDIVGSESLTVSGIGPAID